MQKALHKSNLTEKKMLASTDEEKMASSLCKPNRSWWKDMDVWDKTRISVLFVSENSTEVYPWSHYTQVPACSTTTWVRCPFAPLIKQEAQLGWTQGVWLLSALKARDKERVNTAAFPRSCCVVLFFYLEQLFFKSALWADHPRRTWQELHRLTTTKKKNKQTKNLTKNKQTNPEAYLGTAPRELHLNSSKECLLASVHMTSSH